MAASTFPPRRPAYWHTGILAYWFVNLLNLAGSHGRFLSRVSAHPAVIGKFPAMSLAEEIATSGSGQIRALVGIVGNPTLPVLSGAALNAVLNGLGLMVPVNPMLTGLPARANYVPPPCRPLAKDHYPQLLTSLALPNFSKFSLAL